MLLKVFRNIFHAEHLKINSQQTGTVLHWSNRLLYYINEKIIINE